MGTLIVGYGVLKTIKDVWWCLLHPFKDLFKIYGDKEDGLLLQMNLLELVYAKKIAKEGFNLLLITRDNDKLEEKRNETLRFTKNPHKIQTIPFDFSKPYLLQSVRECYSW